MKSKNGAILIAGGTAGIGLAIARRTARPGIRLFLSYRSDDAAALRARDELQQFGEAVFLIKGDTAFPEGAKFILGEVAKQTTALIGLVHCEALASAGALVEKTSGDVQETVRAGGLSLLYLIQPALKLLTDGSAIVYVSGEPAGKVVLGQGAPALAWIAGESIVRYLAVECAPRGITVNAIRCGPTEPGPEEELPYTLLGRTLMAEDPAGLAELLLSPDGAMITGQTITVDGGLNVRIRRGS